MNINLDLVNFWYGNIRKDNVMLNKDRLMLLRNTFCINIELDNISYSEVVQRINYTELDRSMKVRIKFSPVQLVLPQAVYTYILRSNDLNLGFTDGMKDDFFFVKW